MFENNIVHVTQIAYLILSSVFEFNEAPFRTRCRNSQPLFNDELAFFMTTFLLIKLIVVYVLSKKPQNRAQCLNAKR